MNIDYPGIRNFMKIREAANKEADKYLEEIDKHVVHMLSSDNQGWYLHKLNKPLNYLDFMENGEHRSLTYSLSKYKYWDEEDEDLEYVEYKIEVFFDCSLLIPMCIARANISFYNYFNYYKYLKAFGEQWPGLLIEKERGGWGGFVVTFAAIPLEEIKPLQIAISIARMAEMLIQLPIEFAEVDMYKEHSTVLEQFLCIKESAESACFELLGEIVRQLAAIDTKELFIHRDLPDPVDVDAEMLKVYLCELVLISKDGAAPTMTGIVGPRIIDSPQGAIVVVEARFSVLVDKPSRHPPIRDFIKRFCAANPDVVRGGFENNDYRLEFGRFEISDDFNPKEIARAVLEAGLRIRKFLE